ncbi:MAG: hypothetical protein ACJA2G_000177 [Cognaticolwellia sp.]|jgi:hypothetical protein
MKSKLPLKKIAVVTFKKSNFLINQKSLTVLLMPLNNMNQELSETTISSRLTAWFYIIGKNLMVALNRVQDLASGPTLLHPRLHTLTYSLSVDNTKPAHLYRVLH